MKLKIMNSNINVNIKNFFFCVNCIYIECKTKKRFIIIVQDISYKNCFNCLHQSVIHLTIQNQGQEWIYV